LARANARFPPIGASASSRQKGFAPVTEDRSEAGTKPLRVVHVLRAPVGGLFRHVLDLSQEQIARGHDVGLIADSLTGGARAEAQFAELAPHLALGLMRVPMRRMPHPSDLAVLAAVDRRIGELRPDVVHGHGSKGGLYARLAGLAPWRSSAVRAYTPHGGSINYRPGSWSHRVFMAMERLLAYRTDVLLFESAYIADRFEAFVGAPPGLAHIVPNGIGPREFEPTSPNPDAAEVLYVGEFRAAKGLDTLIEALSLLARKTNRRPRVVLVGDGLDKSALREHADRAGVATQLTFEKPMPAREAFALGRIMVVPSRAESLPYIVLEAAGARLPLIATDVGGMSEIFGPYRERLIPCDDPQVLSNALLRTLDEAPDEQRARADALADYVASRFSLSIMVDQIISGYREAIVRRSGH
jgi:glycosyltransferase involved in cell wall biosynthesis